MQLKEKVSTYRLEKSSKKTMGLHHGRTTINTRDNCDRSGRRLSRK